jgi:pyruvate-formate lyase-activating enzyme
MDDGSEVMKKSKTKAIPVAAQALGFFASNPFTKKILSCLALVFYDINFISPGTHKDHMGNSFHGLQENFRILLISGNSMNSFLIIPGGLFTDNDIYASKL